MFVMATSSFYKTANDIVFKAEAGSSKIRQKDSFEVEKNTNFLQNKTKVNFFSDEKQISLKLNEDALNLLKNHFQKQDFISLDDGSVGLSGSANAYVSGWHKDILENRNFKSADINQDGQIKNDEFMLLKNEVSDKYSIQDLRNMGHIVLREAKSSSGYASNKIQEKSISLNEILSQSIKSDKNFDGNLTRLEFATQGGNLSAGYENIAKKALKKLGVSASNLIIDKDDKISSSMNGKSMAQVENDFKTINLKPRKTDDEHLKALLLRYPNLSAIIKNNPNISENELKIISEKQKITKKYLENESKFNENFTNLALELHLKF